VIETHSTRIIDLSGPWTLKSASEEAVCEMSLPGDVLSALYDAGQLPDPYAAANELDVRWVADQDWILERTVVVEHQRYQMTLSQLDCIAEVRVNGEVVLAAENAFRRHRADVSSALRVGENTIQIKLFSPTAAANARQEEQPYFVPYTKNYPVPNGNMLRKPQCDFGWDWNPALMPMGCYGTLQLEEKKACAIADLVVNQLHSDEGVTLLVEAKMVGKPPIGATMVAIFDGEAVPPSQISESGIRFAFQISDPKLWWPAGHGAQPLFDLTVRIDQCERKRRIGLRTIELINEPDDAGHGLKLRVNGQDIFAKGANWIPADALPGRITEVATRDLLQSAVDANMNMIRVWGGGWYEPDWFYDICDELGLLIWQDAMFACSLYPATEDFLNEVDAEVRDVALRLHHHACIALWCGDNELIGALTWYEESLKDRDRYLVAYDRLNRTIERALKETLYQANWWPSSPAAGPLDFGDAWHDDSSGDMHFWSVWHEGRDFEHYRDVSPRFCSEFGFQSFPSIDVCRTFADESDMNIASPVMEAHQKNTGGNARIAETMFRYFRFPKTFEDFVYLSQVQQALAIKTAVTHWRSLMPHCMGTLYWQLNDTWPCASWSSLDYRGGWKLLHHAAKAFYAPQTVVAVPGNGSIRLVAVNDGPAVDRLKISAFALGMDGETRALGQTELEVGSMATADALTLDTSSIRADEVLLFDWVTASGLTGEDHFAPLPYKSLTLSNSHVSVDVSEDGTSIALGAKATALFVSLEPDQPGRLSDNGVLLRPGTPKKLTFAPATTDTPPTFQVRDLYSATCA